VILFIFILFITIIHKGNYNKYKEIVDIVVQTCCHKDDYGISRLLGNGEKCIINAVKRKAE